MRRARFAATTRRLRVDRQEDMEELLLALFRESRASLKIVCNCAFWGSGSAGSGAIGLNRKLSEKSGGLERDACQLLGGMLL